MSAARHLGEQLHLFRPQETRAATPGDRPAQEHFEQWLQHPNVRFHGTFHPGWEDNLTAHYGTRGQATYRLHEVAKGLAHDRGWVDSYYSGGDSSESFDYGDDDDDFEHIGHVFARKLPNTSPRHEDPVSDNVGNRVDYLNYVRHGREDWEIPKSVRESAAPTPEEWKEPDDKVAEMEKHWPTVTALADTLEHGHRIDYRNNVESGTVFESSRIGGRYSPISSLARPRDTTTWEQERLADPHASRASQDFARQRIEQGTASTVPFETNEPDPNGVALKLGGGWHGKAPSRERSLSRLQFKTEDE